VWQVDGIPLVKLMNMIRDGSRDDADNAEKFGGSIAHVAAARHWLMDRHVIS